MKMSTPAKKSRAKPVSRLLGAVHETARDLAAAGFIDLRRMREYDALCLDPVPSYSSAKIRALRARHKLSQAVFASVLNTSLSTVRQWEIGDKQPSGPSLKLLNLLDRKGLEVLI
jgi:putative transcriptional regulator